MLQTGCVLIQVESRPGRTFRLRCPGASAALIFCNWAVNSFSPLLTAAPQLQRHISESQQSDCQLFVPSFSLHPSLPCSSSATSASRSGRPRSSPPPAAPPWSLLERQRQPLRPSPLPAAGVPTCPPLPQPPAATAAMSCCRCCCSSRRPPVGRMAKGRRAVGRQGRATQGQPDRLPGRRPCCTQAQRWKMARTKM